MAEHSDRPYDIITIGDLCVDMVVELGETLPRFGQAEQWVRDYDLELGGSASLFACQAARLGLRVGLLGRVGDDAYGALVLQRLRDSGVDTRQVRVDPALKTGLGLALCRAGGDRAILTYGGSLQAVAPEDVTDEFLASGQHLHYASYYLHTQLLPVAPDLLRRARALGLSVSLDTNWDPEERWEGGLDAALAQADLFLPNEQEAAAIARREGLEASVAWLAERVPVVAVKRGERGALLRQGQCVWEAPVEPVEVLADTIGAGDAFDAGFVAAWLRGLPLPECAAVGNACGRATTRARGGWRGQLTARELGW